MPDAKLRESPEEFAAKPCTTGSIEGSTPMTGAEYLDSIRDGCEVYIYGERVEDVTEHPAFRNTARMTARLYDARLFQGAQDLGRMHRQA
jgi:aromatic ring hydroxylase